LDINLAVLKADLAGGVCATCCAFDFFTIFIQGRISTMEFAFEFDGLHHALNDKTQICRACTLGQYFIEMQLGDSAELLRQ